jgi:hypothetical protein
MSACSTVIKVSTRTASRLPEISVDDIGDHIICFVPGARSMVTAGIPGVTNTSQFSVISSVATSVLLAIISFPPSILTAGERALLIPARHPTYPANELPNIGFPLLDCASVASPSLAYLEFASASHLLSLRLVQLVCQLNSLNRRNFTVQEIAELSEILTVQKNARALVSWFAEATQ